MLTASQGFPLKTVKHVGKMVAVGEVPGCANVKAGTVLYKVLWKDSPPEIATWEDESCIHDDYIDAYEAGLEAEALRGGDLTLP